MQQRWSEEQMREVIADLASEAVPETYEACLAEASAETGIPEKVIDNRFRRERGAPELSLQRNAELRELRAQAARAQADLPDGIELAGWTPAAGIIVELGGVSLAFVGYDRFQSGDMFLIDRAGNPMRLAQGDPRIGNVLNQINPLQRRAGHVALAVENNSAAPRLLGGFTGLSGEALRLSDCSSDAALRL